MRRPMHDAQHDGTLVDYCAGRQTPTEAADTERHLAGCARCRSFVQRQRELDELLGLWSAEPVASDFDRRLHKRIEADEQRGWLGRLLGERADWKPGLPLAAAAGAAVLAVFLSAPPSRVAPGPEVIQQRTRVDTLDAEQVERAIEDVEMLRDFTSAASRQAL